MLIEKLKFNLSEFFWIASVMLIYIYYFVGNTAFNNVSFFMGTFRSIVYYMAIMFVSVKMLAFTKYTVKSLLFTILFLTVGLLAARYSHSMVPFFSMLYATSAYGIDMRTIAKTYLWLMITSVTIMLLGALSGHLMNFAYRNRQESDVVRYAMGDSYPTQLSARISFAFFTWLYLRDFKKGLSVTLIGATLILFMAHFLDARLDEILVSTGLILTFVSNDFMMKFLNRIRMFVAIVPIVMLGALFFLIKLYIRGVPLAYVLDKVLSSRIYFSALGVERFSDHTLFGQVVPMVGSGGLNGVLNAQFRTVDYFFIDSAYLSILLQYGVIFVLIVFAVYAMASLRMFKSNNVAYELFFIMLAAHWFIAPYIVDISTMPLWAMAMSVFLMGSSKEMANSLELTTIHDR